MPNWIKGTFKVRGKREDIKRFLDNELEVPGGYFSDKNKDISNFVNDYSEEDYIEYNITDEIYLKDTRRAFIQEGLYGMYEEYGTICLNIKQAWSFYSESRDIEILREKSREYNVDFKLYGFESGMEFCQEVIITKKGEINFANTIQYEDWAWDCPFPMMGG